MSVEVARTDKSEQDADLNQFVLQKVQPALLGLMDGSVSTLAPLFATAGLTHSPASSVLRRPGGLCGRGHQHGAFRGALR